MWTVTLDYLEKAPKSGNLRYRRRVPTSVREQIGKIEFLKVLGKTEAEALPQYRAFHLHVERVIRLAKIGVAGLTPAEQREHLAAQLEEWGADPHSAGRDDNERTWRGEAAERLIEGYQDHDTGDYVDVPEETEAIAGALLSGVAKESPEPTIRDAFKDYLKENALPIAEQRKKQMQRFGRQEANLLLAVGGNIKVSDLTRPQAKKWRDLRLETGVSPNTVRRERNDIAAVMSYAIEELGVVMDKNPFHKLKTGKAVVSRQMEREPLPPEVISGVYLALHAKRPDLVPIWTLLDLTGARPSEIRMLMAGEIILDHPVPHIIIQERDERTLKTLASTRLVPLIGAALEVARGAVRGINNPSAPLFPRYAKEGGMDNLSAALNRRVRALTKNPKHVTYSLRHNMKDRLRAGEVFKDTQKAIQGHMLGSDEEANYGGPVPLEIMRDGLLKALAGYEPPTRPAPKRDNNLGSDL